jgi:hypothetical protein
VYPVLEIPRTFWEGDGRETYPGWEVCFYLDDRFSPPHHSYPPDISANETAATIDFCGTWDGEHEVAIPWNTAGVVNGRHTIIARIARVENGELAEIFHEISATFRINNPFALTYYDSSRGQNAIHERLEGAQVSDTIIVVTEILCQADPHISGITLKLDGTEVESASGEWKWNTTGVANGLHTIEADIGSGIGKKTATAVFTVLNH